MTDNVKLKPYDGVSDFTMWKVKMKAILIKGKCYKAISEEWPLSTSNAEKKDMQDLAHSEIMIHLADDVARQVVSHSQPKALWNALAVNIVGRSVMSVVAGHSPPQVANCID